MNFYSFARLGFLTFDFWLFIEEYFNKKKVSNLKYHHHKKPLPLSCLPQIKNICKYFIINYNYANTDQKRILSKKLKIKQQIELTTITNGLEDIGNTKLLKADDENIWILYSDHLVNYNHKTKKLVKLTDLSLWQPQTALLDQENIWLISGKDGLLYGISL